MFKKIFIVEIVCFFKKKKTAMSAQDGLYPFYFLTPKISSCL